MNITILRYIIILSRSSLELIMINYIYVLFYIKFLK